jgi:hypothetical protein
MLVAGNSGVLSMATQTVMDHTGDTRHIFDATDEDAVSMSAWKTKQIIARAGVV